MAKKILIPAIFTVSIAIAAFSFLYITQKKTFEKTTPEKTGPNITTPISTPEASIPVDWKTYTSTTGSTFSVSYPPEVTLQEQGDGRVAFYMWGPTQVEGTEIFDGLSVALVSGSHPEVSLLEYVEDQWATGKSDPIYQYISDIKEVTIAGLSGYEYSGSALGDYRFIYLPLKNYEHLEIVILTEDPGLLGFDDIVENMLSTIKVNETVL